MSRSRRRRARHEKCPATGKTRFYSYNRAAQVAGRIDPEARVYSCTSCGSYHMTSYSSAHYDRTQAERKEAS